MRDMGKRTGREVEDMEMAETDAGMEIVAEAAVAKSAEPSTEKPRVWVFRWTCHKCGVRSTVFAVAGGNITSLIQERHQKLSPRCRWDEYEVVVRREK